MEKLNKNQWSSIRNIVLSVSGPKQRMTLVFDHSLSLSLSLSVSVCEIFICFSPIRISLLLKAT